MNKTTKPVIVFYVNVGNLSEQDVHQYLEMVRENVGDFNGEYHKLVIPVRDQETRVDLLTPNLIYAEKEDLEKFKQASNRLFFETEQLLKRMPYLSRNILLIEKTMKP
jgi:hypothetical protein